MFHGWKKNLIKDWDSPFEREIDLSLCGNSLRAWHWRADKKVTPDEMRKNLQTAEKYYLSIFPDEARVIPLLDE
ncbi:hypothetical protein Y032_0002g732 [Ancylostoma ceylanicum]|nr:hypothetical protein Y032_0002g732 [Ancylostoma ceylanicum]